jgi:hypothetical protein
VFKSPENINHADQILPEVCGTTLRRLVVAKPYTSFPFWKKSFFWCKNDQNSFRNDFTIIFLKNVVLYEKYSVKSRVANNYIP